MRELMRALVALVIVAVTVSSSAARADSRVLNGGDVLRLSLENVRGVLIDVMDLMGTTIYRRDRLVSLCEDTRRFSLDEAELCADFLIEVAPQIITMNTREQRVKFVIEEIVTAPDANGIERLVDAATYNDNVSSILVADHMRFASPRELLGIVTHEFGHKVEYQGTYVRDHYPVAAGLTGNAFLDAVASVVVDIANDMNRLGESFILYDKWFCESTRLSDGHRVDMRATEPRRPHNDDGLYTSYDAGFGYGEPAVAVEANGSFWWPRIRVIAEGDCNSASASAATLAEIVREDRDGNVVVEHSQGFHVNPICGGTLRFEGSVFAFACRYVQSFVK